MTRVYVISNNLMECGMRDFTARYLLGVNLQFAIFDVASDHEADRMRSILVKLCTIGSTVDVTRTTIPAGRRNDRDNV